MKFRCAVCGEYHDELPHVGQDRPDQWWGVPEMERETRFKLTEDTCVLDGEYYFIRGVIEIPVHEYPEKFGFGVWVSLKKENFETYLANFDSPEIGPFFGRLSSLISYYGEDTMFLKTMAHFQGAVLRPTIVLEPATHLLVRHQQDGISLEKAMEIVHYYQD